MTFRALLFLAAVPLAGCVQDPAYNQARADLRSPVAARYQTGMASHYSFAGRRTASGQIANPNGMTAAHRTLPFGTLVEVTNQRTGQSVVVRINDRGPFVKGRVIDLSTGAARQIGFTGVAPVSLAVVSMPERVALR